jgi:acyl-homoserine-lactone acylase
MISATRPASVRLLLPALLALGLPVGCAPQTRTAAPAAPVAAEILWDSWGVPHIVARTDRDLYRAFGWAQMHSHGDRILRLYGESRGRGAEYWGEAALASDRWLHTNDVPERARLWYAAQQPAIRDLLDGFVEGMNAYAEAHPDRLAEEVRVVLPIEPTDVLAHVQRLIHFSFVIQEEAVAAISGRWRQAAAGSNAWAIAPARSASGHAMLLANPHLQWAGSHTFYEAHLVAPGMNVSGAALIGLPHLVIAFNDDLGWTHTVNTIDAADLYALTLEGDGYRFDGAVLPFETSERVIQVRQPDGSLRPERLTVRRSVHGPVVAERPGGALALRVAGLDQPHMFAQYREMTRARNRVSFEAALARLQIPLFTVLYADRHGQILHVFNGRVPRRATGDWAYWTSIVRGDTSATLWTDTHAYGELPRVLDPPSGWLQNSNDPPWTTTLPYAIDPADYPPYMAPRFLGARSQRSLRMLMERERVSFEELVEDKHSTRAELADRLLDDLVAAARAHGDGDARRAADVLLAWDRHAEADSRGAVLFDEFFRSVIQTPWPRGLFATPFDPARPLDTPAGFAEPTTAARLLGEAARRVEQQHGALDVPWGDVHRLRGGDLDLPANGGPGVLGIFRVTETSPAADGRRVAFFGDSYTAAVEFSTPIRARALMPYGNASQPGSPHAWDQLELYARKELRPVWRTRAEIEANLARRELF